MNVDDVRGILIALWSWSSRHNIWYVHLYNKKGGHIFGMGSTRKE